MTPSLYSVHPKFIRDGSSRRQGVSIHESVAEITVIARGWLGNEKMEFGFRIEALLKGSESSCVQGPHLLLPSANTLGESMQPTQYRSYLVLFL